MIIYDTMSRAEIKLDLPEDRVIKIFVCGPTVYDSSHVGHARTYIFFDSFVKYLRSRGYNVFYLLNITDIDDKIITKAREEKAPYEEISGRYKTEFFSIMKTLRVDSINFYALATKHIPEIIEQIEILIKKGYAYETSDGVYFQVSKFKDYGRLSGQDLEALKAGARVESSEEKKDPRDFAVWKKMKPGEPYWESPWGKGRPGWHVEDTAITEKYFGPTYDIHGGGTDLIFPHHEAEIAIERSISGSDHLARYWLHSAMINVNEVKMSKSLKNYVTIKAILEDYLPEELRFALLNVQFKTTVNFSQEIMNEARANVVAINTLYRKLILGLAKQSEVRKQKNMHIASLAAVLENGFDFRAFFRDFLMLMGDWNSRLDSMGAEERRNAIETMEWVDSFAGILRKSETAGNKQELVETMLKLRRKLRDNRDFASADQIRSSLRELGIYIEDKGEETIWWQT